MLFRGHITRFAFLFATLVASNWGIRIARWLREWARRNSSLEEPPSNPNAGDLKCCSLSLVTSYLEVCGQVFAFDRPTCYPCPLCLRAAHIMPYTSMVEASERTQSTSECWPKGEAGRAPLTKAVSFKRFLVLLSGRLCSAGWRVKDQSKFLGCGAASAQFPDVD